MFLRATIAAFCLLAGAAQAQSFDDSPSRRDPEISAALVYFDTELGNGNTASAAPALVEALKLVLVKSNSGLSVRDEYDLAYALSREFDFVTTLQVQDSLAINVDWFPMSAVRLPTSEASCEQRLSRFGYTISSRSFGAAVWTGTPAVRYCEVRSDDGANAFWIYETIQPHGNGALIVRIAFHGADIAIRDAVADNLADMPEMIWRAVRTPRR